MMKKRGLFIVLLAFFLLIFSSAFQAQENLITCGTSEGCSLVTENQCTAAHGDVLTEADAAAKCVSGCCRFPLSNGKQFCEYGTDFYQCKQLQRNYLGSGEAEGWYSASQQQCLTACQGTLTPAQLTVTVRDDSRAPLAAAQLILRDVARTERAPTSLGEGSFLFNTLEPGVYTLTVTVEGFASQSLSVSLTPGDSISREIILHHPGVARISGTIFFTEGTVQKTLAGAQLSWTGPQAGQLSSLTESDGRFSVNNLPEGVYTFEASLPSHPEEGVARRIISLTASQEMTAVDFVLRPELFQGVSGIITLEGNPIPGASIFLDGVFVRRSEADGRYRVALPVNEASHRISASYAGYYQSPEENFFLTNAQPEATKNLLLQRLPGACNPENIEETQGFSALSLAGEEKVLLVWTPPQCAQDVQAYQLVRSDKPEQLFTFRPEQTSFVDTDVEWEKTYTYTLRILYKFPEDAASRSSAGVTASITLGTELCAQQQSLCSVDGKQVGACNEQNKISWGSCSADQACGPTAQGQATCRQLDPCLMGGDPFGLFYSKLACYGSFFSPSKPAKYCVFDTTNSLVDSCRSCTAIKSCFDYRSKDACEINSCRAETCTWIDAGKNKEPVINYAALGTLLAGELQNAQFVSKETGAGYCVEKNYNHDDKCSLCDFSQPPFLDYFCTAQVCSSLGKCFSNENLNRCASCGKDPSAESTCYSYTTELECTSGKPVSEAGGILSLSADRCGWGTCLWKGPSNSLSTTACVKDGNADGSDDCQALLGAERSKCEQDNSPPRTVVQGSSLPTLSLATPTLTFTGDDSFHTAENQRNDLGTFHLCVLPARADAPATCSEEQSVTLNYLAHAPTANIAVNILNLIPEAVDGERYRLLFSSEDIYHNKEPRQETFVFVDNVPPSFHLNQSIVTVEDRTALTVWLDDPSELMSCNFTLFAHGSHALLQDSVTKTIQEAQRVNFAELVNVVAADLNVSCSDIVGNVHSQLQSYLFDLEEKITITAPQRFENTTTFTFAVDTTVESECTLQKSSTGEIVAPFHWVDANPKHHVTSPLSGFLPGDYPGDYKVVCDAFADIKNFEDYFHFTVDITPPKTKVTLREGARTVVPQQRVWEESFVSSAQVTLECVEEGIPCAQTLYCTGDETSCPPLPGPAYQPYTPGTPLSFTSSTRLCYYSTDQAHNKVFSASCGKIAVVGYGITLQHPEGLNYQNEIWGISSLPVFPLQMSVVVPTQECRLSFTPGFSYDDVPKFQILSPNEQEKYVIQNFPADVFQEFPSDGGVKNIFVQCKALSGDLSPVQKFVLEYDPYAPSILQSHADPSTIYEGIRTNLFVTTDKKTFCRYSDTSDRQVSPEFSNMAFSFPGFTERTLYGNHQDQFTLNNFVSADGKKEYRLTTQCSSGAGLLSLPQQISFAVDYSEKGFIIAGSLLPAGYVEGPDVPISLQTSKSATCEYRFPEKYTLFTETGGTTHTATLSGLGEGSYSLPVKCTMSGGHVVENVISFTIDHSGPVIWNITDGNLTCGSPYIDVFVYTDEPALRGYLYELYDRGNQSDRGNKSIQQKGNVSFEQPLRFSTQELREGHTYTFSVQAVDAVGNRGAAKESDGVKVLSQNDSLCITDEEPPRVTPIINATGCKATFAELLCEDRSQCLNFTFAIASAANECNQTNSTIAYNHTYAAGKISFERSGWICYRVEDARKNVLRDQLKVDFSDDDGDGIANTCDICFGTQAGKVVDSKGCADHEIPTNTTKKDTDGDGLPDAWEELQNTADCPLSSATPDSDNDGIGDGDEDYDGDGLSNYNEYLVRSDPCLRESGVLPKQQNVTPQLPSAGNCFDGIKNQNEVHVDCGGVCSSCTQPSLEKKSFLPWILLVTGLLLLLGGMGYLIYLFRFSRSSAGSRSISEIQRTEGFAFEEKAISEKPAKEERREDFSLSRPGREHLRARKRHEVFGAFDQASAVIPHVEKIFEKKASVLEKVGEAAKQYLAHKEIIAPGLKPEEKGIFSQLEQVAKNAEKKDIRELLAPEKAQDLFSQLKNLAKKRKKGA